MSEAIPEDLMEKANDVAFDCDPTKSADEIANYIAVALLAERKETIERCAAIAEYDGNLLGLAGARIAAAIRSLGRE